MDLAAGFVFGLVLGVMLGVIVGPFVQARLGRREWIAASRETELADRLLRALEEIPETSAMDGHHAGNSRPQASRRGHHH